MGSTKAIFYLNGETPVEDSSLREEGAVAHVVQKAVVSARSAAVLGRSRVVARKLQEAKQNSQAQAQG